MATGKSAEISQDYRDTLTTRLQATGRAELARLRGRPDAYSEGMLRAIAGDLGLGSDDVWVAFEPGSVVITVVDKS